MVIVSHIEGFKNKAGLDNLFNLPFIKSLGPQGVSIFFVLSGFLITYFLLNEQWSSNTIAIKKFYIRRVLSIWPLYFLILTLGFFIIPLVFKVDYFTQIKPFFEGKIILAIFLMPNVLYLIFGHILMIGPL